MEWVVIGQDTEGNDLVGLVDNDGLMKITATSEHKPYLEWKAWVEAGNAPEDFWTQPSE